MARNSFIKAICIGIIAGMRSMSAPAIVSNSLAAQHSQTLDDSSLKFMGSEKVAKVFTVAAMGEMVADKLPIIPARIEPGPLTGRIISGALCGATICTAEGESAKVGAIVGGLSALASAYAFYHLRRKIAETKVVTDIVIGLSEDALVIGGSSMILNEDSSK